MSTIKTNKIVNASSSTDNLTLADNGNVTVGADLIATKQNGCERLILETIAFPCDGGTYSSSAGDITAPDVTATVDTTTTFTDVAGSKVTYTPPAGATTVIYEFNFSVGAADSHGISHWIGFIDGTEIAYQKFSISANNLIEGVYHYKLVIPIGGTTSTDTGRQATWTSGKELKLQDRN